MVDRFFMVDLFLLLASELLTHRHIAMYITIRGTLAIWVPALKWLCLRIHRRIANNIGTRYAANYTSMSAIQQCARVAPCMLRAAIPG
jgi:hypothetical protein